MKKKVFSIGINTFSIGINMKNMMSNEHRAENVAVERHYNPNL